MKRLLETRSTELALQNGGLITQNKWKQNTEEWKLKLRQQYGDIRNFVEMYHESKMNYYANDPIRCVSGDTPTLREVVEVYSQNMIEAWIASFVESLALYCGDKTMGRDKSRSCASVILTNYPDLHVAELILFFSNVRAGKYGHFYGSIDLMCLVSWIPRFIEERKDWWAQALEEKHQREEQAAAMAEVVDEERTRPMYHDEFLRWKELHPEEFRKQQEMIERGATLEELRCCVC